MNFLKCGNDEPSNVLQSCVFHLLKWSLELCNDKKRVAKILSLSVAITTLSLDSTIIFG